MYILLIFFKVHLYFNVTKKKTENPFPKKLRKVNKKFKYVLKI